MVKGLISTVPADVAVTLGAVFGEKGSPQRYLLGIKTPMQTK